MQQIPKSKLHNYTLKIPCEKKPKKAFNLDINTLAKTGISCIDGIPNLGLISPWKPNKQLNQRKESLKYHKCPTVAWSWLRHIELMPALAIYQLHLLLFFIISAKKISRDLVCLYIFFVSGVAKKLNKICAIFLQALHLVGLNNYGTKINKMYF